MSVIYKKFALDNPETSDEKLMIEGLQILDQSLGAFVKLNFARQGMSSNQLNIIRDTVMAFAGNTIRSLSGYIKNDADKEKFETSVKDQFEMYLEHLPCTN